MHKDLSNPHYVDWLYFLEGTEGWTREQIESYQAGEIRRVVAHAYRNAVGYKRLYDDRAGIWLDDILSPADLRHLPFTTREMIRDNLAAFSVPTRDSEYTMTGGSSGVPVGFWRDRTAFAKELASKAHQYRRVGWREGDRQIVLRGIPIDTPDHTIFLPEFNELRFSSFHLTPEWMWAYYRKSIEYEPQWLRCYPSAGYLFARWLKDEGLTFPQLKGVLCASENLYGFQKDLLTEVFGGRIFSHYGQWELTVLAGYCEHKDTYHVLPQYGYAELIGPDRQPVTEPGQAGEIVGTSFIMSATPFIRYRTGDFAVLKGWGCPACGRPYQVWERIEGREQEFIVTTAGRRISLTSLHFHDDTLKDIAQFQFRQSHPGSVTVCYVPRDGHGLDEEKFLSRLRVKLEDNLEIVLQAVDHIPPTPRGKRLLSIREVADGK